MMASYWIRQARHTCSMRERKQNKKYILVITINTSNTEQRKQIEREKRKLRQKSVVLPPRGCGRHLQKTSERHSTTTNTHNNTENPKGNTTDQANRRTTKKVPSRWPHRFVIGVAYPGSPYCSRSGALLLCQPPPPSVQHTRERRQYSPTAAGCM